MMQLFNNQIVLDKEAVGLGNVDNTSDNAKPISTANQTALNTKVNKNGDTFTGDIAATNLSGTNTGNETVSSIGGLVNSSASATPNDSDLVAIVDTGIVKKITWANVKVFLSSFFVPQFKTNLTSANSFFGGSTFLNGSYINVTGRNYTTPPGKASAEFVIGNDIGGLGVESSFNLVSQNYVGGFTNIFRVVGATGNTTIGGSLTATNISGINTGDQIRSILLGQSGSVSALAVAKTDYFYIFTATGTLTLPTAIGNINQYVVKNVAGTTTINTTASQTIDGSTTILITTANTSLTFISNNTNWITI